MRIRYYLPAAALLLAGALMLPRKSSETSGAAGPAAESGAAVEAALETDALVVAPPRSAPTNATAKAEAPRIGGAKEIAAMRDHLDEAEDFEALLAARTLVKHPDRSIRMEALQAMQWIGAPAAYDITSFFDDADPEIRALSEEAFSEAIEEVGDPVLQVRMLEITLKSSSPEARYLALEDLIFLPDHLNFKPMASMLDDPVEDVRDLARDNLEFVSEEEFATEAEALAWFAAHERELKARQVETGAPRSF